MKLNMSLSLRNTFYFFLGLIAPMQALSQQTVGSFLNDTASFDGYTLVSPLLSDSTYLIDNCGYKVKTWSSDYRPGFATYLLENGNLLRTAKIQSNIFSGGGTGGLIQEFNWEGDLVWDYQFADKTKHQHHDIEPLPNGNHLILSWSFFSDQDALDHGKNPSDVQASFWPTLISEVQPIYPDSAIIVWEWNAWDHLIQDLDPAKPNYGVVADHPELIDINQPSLEHRDWLHCNSVKYNPNLDQIVMSSRNCNEIYVIDHSTTWAEAGTHTGGNQGKGGDILYRWGNPINYHHGTVDDQILFYPHDVHWIADSLENGGKMFIFNNGGGVNGSAVELISTSVDQNGSYSFTPGTSYAPIAADWRFEASWLNSAHTSGAQRLPNGNTLICEGGDGNIFELNAEDSIVWQYVNPAGGTGIVTQGNYPAQQTSLFRATRYPASYPAFIGKDLSPISRIELEPYPSDCEITAEPIDSAITGGIKESLAFDVKVNGLISDVLSITVNTNDQYAVRVFDLTGRETNQMNVQNGLNSISAENWPSGQYFLSITSRTNSTTQFYQVIKI
ncbi:MAG: hypothetical protein ACI9FU_001758 [Granulosicoccus sp.]|jgi:hypothetical protein